MSLGEMLSMSNTIDKLEAELELERRAPEWFFKTYAEFPWWKRIVWRVFGKKRFGADNTEFGRVEVTGYKFRGVTLIYKTRFLDWESK